MDLGNASSKFRMKKKGGGGGGEITLNMAPISWHKVIQSNSVIQSHLPSSKDKV